MFTSAQHTATARVDACADSISAELDALEAALPDAWTLELLEALDPALLDDRSRVRALALSQRLAAHAHAIGLRMAAAIESTEGPDDWAQDEVACALGVGSMTGARLLNTARALSGRLRETGALLDAGLISPRKADVLAERTAHLDDRAAAQVEATVLPAAAAQTPFAFTNAVRAAVINADPAEADRRARHARAHGDVTMRPGEDSMARLIIDAPAPEILAAWKLIDGLAGPGHPDDPRLVGERRVDAFLSLINARYDEGNLPTRHGRPISIGITMTLGTALGAEDVAANLAGYGPIPPAMARGLAAQGSWRAWILDATTAHLTALGTKSYRPDQATSDLILARDATCTFAFCDVPADLCDIDHAVTYDEGGATDPANCGPVSRRHHLAKHGRWQLTRAPNGTCTWTSPLGFTYTTTPPAQPLQRVILN